MVEEDDNEREIAAGENKADSLSTKADSGAAFKQTNQEKGSLCRSTIRPWSIDSVPLNTQKRLKRKGGRCRSTHSSADNGNGSQ